VVRSPDLGYVRENPCPVRNICAAAPLPTNPHPLVEFVKINRPGQHQQPGRDVINNASRQCQWQVAN
jgi:hypothetical protein